MVIDPFCLNTNESSHLPPFNSGDLVSYLVLQINYLSAKQFRAHKSLEAYNQFTSGWVKEVHTWNIGEKYVVANWKSKSTQMANLLAIIIIDKC